MHDNLSLGFLLFAQTNTLGNSYAPDSTKMCEMCTCMSFYDMMGILPVLFHFLVLCLRLRAQQKEIHQTKQKKNQWMHNLNHRPPALKRDLTHNKA